MAAPAPLSDSISISPSSKGTASSVMDKQEQIAKFKKYEAEYKQYLLDKYFSDKDINGGDIYDVEVNVDGQTIKASRTPPYQSFLDSELFDVIKGPAYLGKTSGAGTSKGKGKSKDK